MFKNFPIIILFLILVKVSELNACLCTLKSQAVLRACDSARCNEERVAQEFCRSDFCVEASIKSERAFTGKIYNNITYAQYGIRLVKLYRHSPLALQSIKTGIIYTPTMITECGIGLKRSAIYFLCGKMIADYAVITSCDYIKRTESLTLAERSFFISGYKNVDCNRFAGAGSNHNGHKPAKPGQGQKPQPSSNHQNPGKPNRPPVPAIQVTLPTFAPVLKPNPIQHTKPPMNKPPHTPVPVHITKPPNTSTPPPTTVTVHKPHKNGTKPTKPHKKPTKTNKPDKPAQSTAVVVMPTLNMPTGFPDSEGMEGPPGPPGSPQNGDYFCLLIPINALSLQRFLKSQNGKKGSAIEPNGQYILHCANRFFCIPANAQLQQLSNTSVLSLKSIAYPIDDTTTTEDLGKLYGSRKTEDEFKALIPKLLLPACPEYNETVFVLPPWLITSLTVLQPPMNGTGGQNIPCSDTSVEVDCELISTVTLADATVVTAAPLQDPITPTNISTPDGTVISITIGEPSVIIAPDGTETRLNTDGSSRTVLPDKTLIVVNADKNLNINQTDGTRIAVNTNGMSIVLPDKTIVMSSEYGIVCTTPDGKNTLIPVDSSGAAIHTKSGSDIVVTEGLNAEIKSKSGSLVLITPKDTTIGAKNGGSINIVSDGTVTINSPAGLALTFSTDDYVNVTTGDGTAASIGQDDSLYVINENECIVVFPNGNSLIVTKDELISLESDGRVTVTDSLGSNLVLPFSENNIPCEDMSCTDKLTKLT